MVVLVGLLEMLVDFVEVLNGLLVVVVCLVVVQGMVTYKMILECRHLVSRDVRERTVTQDGVSIQEHAVLKKSSARSSSCAKR